MSAESSATPATERPSVDATPAAARRRVLGARGMMVFLVGFAAAVASAGLGWLLVEPPLTDALAPLVLTVVVYALPPLLMGIGTALAWSDPTGPRVVLGVVAAFTTFAFAPRIANAINDLGASDARPAIVLAHYDCDFADDSGVRDSLTCLELAWTDDDGHGHRDRFLVADGQMPERSLPRGTCLLATIWPRTERVVDFRTVAASHCRESGPR